MERRPITVLQVLPALHSGGVERGVLEVAAALAAAGHRSLVVSAGGRMVSQLEQQGSQHFQLPVGVKSPLTLRLIPRLRSLIRNEQVDLIDVHSRLPAWITSCAWRSLAKAARPALITTFHGLHSVSRYSSIMCRGQRVVVVSATMLDHVLQNYPWVQRSQLELIPRGIERSEFPRGYRADDAWRSAFYSEYPQLIGQSLVTIAGRISRLKGHTDFLEIMAGLRASGAPAHGLIVGESEPGRVRCSQELIQTAEKLNLQEHITFTGQRPDLKDIYSISQVVLNLSQKPESFGRSVAEALSIGTPVVGYDHGGVGEILRAQFPSGAVPVRDIATAAKVTQQILKSAGQCVIDDNPFDRQQMLAMTLRLYQEMCDARLPAAA